MDLAASPSNICWIDGRAALGYDVSAAAASASWLLRAVTKSSTTEAASDFFSPPMTHDASATVRTTAVIDATTYFPRRLCCPPGPMHVTLYFCHTSNKHGMPTNVSRLSYDGVIQLQRKTGFSAEKCPLPALQAKSCPHPR